MFDHKSEKISQVDFVVWYSAVIGEFVEELDTLQKDPILSHLDGKQEHDRN